MSKEYTQAVKNQDVLRSTLEQVREKNHLSLRDLEALTCVSFATLGRFLKGQTTLIDLNARRIFAYLTNKPIPQVKPVSSVVVAVNGHRIRVTTEVIDDSLGE